MRTIRMHFRRLSISKRRVIIEYLVSPFCCYHFLNSDCEIRFGFFYLFFFSVLSKGGIFAKPECTWPFLLATAIFWRSIWCIIHRRISKIVFFIAFTLQIEPNTDRIQFFKHHIQPFKLQIQFFELQSKPFTKRIQLSWISFHYFFIFLWFREKYKRNVRLG